MKCPVCKTELVVWKQLRLETLSDHVLDPNGEQELPLSDAYSCPNTKNCPCTLADGGPVVFWNGDGDLYGNSIGLPFIDNNNAPFGSLSRRLNVEIYKKDENKLLFTIPCWPLKGWKVRSKYSYQSNEDGDILRRKFHLEWITNDGVYHIWGIKMLMFSLKETWKNWKEGCNHNLKRSVEQASWPRAEWWRKINAKVASMAIKYS
jgi:hypothetical protein